MYVPHNILGVPNYFRILRFLFNKDTVGIVGWSVFLLDEIAVVRKEGRSVFFHIAFFFSFLDVELLSLFVRAKKY